MFLNFKKAVVFITCVCISAFAKAQSVGIGTTAPNPSAILEINSSNKGLLLPRVSDTSSVPNPAKGLLVYSLANNKIWFYNGSRWQQAASNAGGMDSLWYRANDSISYSGKKYVGINRDNPSGAPQANLEVNGSLLIQSPQLYSRSAPVAAQTYTMNNSNSLIEVPESDSVFRIFDPGGSGNYNNSSLANIYTNRTSLFQQDGYRLKFNLADFGLAPGDTLWIGVFGYPSCRNNYTYRFTSTSLVPEELAYTDYWLYFSFSSDNVATSKGFDIKVTRVFSSPASANSNITTTGNALQFSNG
ncbi:MAG: hypothetical protein H7X88_07735, partial [Gloeobacteraceae cyanobacterium ES-bin-316]|nr:hypothetical protein [Ferruginibacter sp.]